MATEITSLSLNVKSDSVAKGASRLDKLTSSSTKADKSTKKLTGTTKKGAATMGKSAVATGAASKTTKSLSSAQVGATATTKGLSAATVGLGATLKTTLGPLLALLAPMLAIKKVFSTTVELQDYQAQLKTATGSVEDAAVAFEKLEGFASETPYALEQSLEAFIKLTNFGLTPSEKALRSYGNTASAMGRDLNQMIEAVADAITGEFERLKEFGIKAKSEGDKVSFTFRGVTTQIGKNAAEIEGYLMSIGENEFASAMADRMDTLGGKVSNLGDTFNKLFRSISESGVDTIFAAAVDDAIRLLQEMNAMVESRQFELELKSWTIGVEAWGRSFADTLDIINGLLNDNSEETESWFTEFTNGIKMLPSLLHILVKTFGEFSIAMVTSIGAVSDALTGERSLAGATETIKIAFEGMHAATKDNIAAFDRETIAIENTTKAAKSAREEFDRLTAAKKREAEFLAAVDDFIGVTKTPAKGATKEKDFNAGTKDVDFGPKSKALTSEYEEALEIQKVYAKKSVLIEADRSEEIEKLNRQRMASQMAMGQTAANLLQTLASTQRGKDEESLRRYQALSITAATISTYTGATQAYNDPDVPNVYLRMANAAAIVASGLVQVDNIRNAGNYATGGIVPGTSMTGDNVRANVNSGEMILNRAQQSRLFDIANSGNTSTSGVGSTQLNVTVENHGSSKITVERISETDVRIIAREVVREEAPATIAADLGNPNSRTSTAIARNTNTQRRRD